MEPQKDNNSNRAINKQIKNIQELPSDWELLSNGENNASNLIEKINGEYEETKFILFPNTYKMEETSKNINDDSLDCDFILEEIIID